MNFDKLINFNGTQPAKRANIEDETVNIRSIVFIVFFLGWDKYGN